MGRESTAARTLGLRQRDVVGNGGDDFDAGDEMREFGEIAQHDRGIGADVVLLAQFLEGGGDVAFHQGFEQIDDAHAVGQSQHLPHVFCTHRAGGMGDCLVEQRK